MLMTKPGFTLIAVLTLALGIGANSVIFSVVNAVLLRPLPYEHAERLVRVMRANAKRSLTAQSHSFPNFADLRAQNKVFDALAAYHETARAKRSSACCPRVFNSHLSTSSRNISLRSTPKASSKRSAERAI
jgi:putative ABC transport system permease protein